MADDTEGWRWWCGADGETYTSDHDTREQAIAELDGYGGYVVEARQDPLRLSRYIDAEDILERAEECSDDMKGDGAEPLFEATPEQQADLEARLKAACEDWQDAHGLVFKPWRFTVSRNEEMIEAREYPDAGVVDHG